MQLDQQKAEVADADKAAADAQDQLDALDGQIRELARTAYTGDGLTQLDLLLTSDSADEFLVAAGHARRHRRPHDDVVAQVATPPRRRRRLRAAADARRGEGAEDLRRDLRASSPTSRSQIADYQRQYARLSAAQQARSSTGARRHVGCRRPARRRSRRQRRRPDGGRHRPGADRRPVRVGRRRAGRVRLLRPDAVRLRRRRRQPAALQQQQSQMGTPGVPSASCSPATCCSSTARSATSACTSATARWCTRRRRASRSRSPSLDSMGSFSGARRVALTPQLAAAAGGPVTPAGVTGPRRRPAEGPAQLPSSRASGRSGRPRRAALTVTAAVLRGARARRRHRRPDAVAAAAGASGRSDAGRPGRGACPAEQHRRRGVLRRRAAARVADLPAARTRRSSAALGLTPLGARHRARRGAGRSAAAGCGRSCSASSTLLVIGRLVTLPLVRVRRGRPAPLRALHPELGAVAARRRRVAPRSTPA